MDQERTETIYPLLGDGQPLTVHIAQAERCTAPFVPRRFSQLRTLFAALAGLFFLCILAALLYPMIENMHWQGLLLSLPQDAVFGHVSFFIVSDRLPSEFSISPDFSAEESMLSEDAVPPTTESADDLERYPIAESDLSCGGNIHALSNETDYTPDTQTLLDAALPFASLSAWREKYSDDDPYILILHTHATESYAPEGSISYAADDSFRSDDPEKNMIAVGCVMQECFASAGIPTLHCTEMFDAESYRNAYSLAASAIRSQLEKHPSIQIVLDVHRDSILRADRTNIRPLTVLEGQETAQIMMVVGTDFKGANHPDWQNNLNFALKIQNALTQKEPTLCRAVNLRGAGFNEQYTSGSLLLEIGSCGNTLQQAKQAAITVAQAIVQIVAGDDTPEQ